MACTLPAAILLVLWWKGLPLRRHALALVPFLLLGLALGALAVWMESNPVGAEGAHWSLGPAQRVLLAGRAFWFYLATLLWPHPLVFVYPRWSLDAAALRSYAYPGTALALLGGLWLARGRWGRGPFTALAYFAGTLLPLLGPFNVYFWRYSFVADHFQYLASAGPIALAAAGAALGARRLGPRAGRLTPLAAAVLLALLGGLSWRQAHAYADVETLWRDTLAKNPAAWMAHHNLGVLLRRAGRFEEALVELRAADALTSDDRDIRINLAQALLGLQRNAEAVAILEALHARDPGDFKVAQTLGFTLQAAGRHAEAVAAFDAALRIVPPARRSQLGRAQSLRALGRLDQARAIYDRILGAHPADATAHAELGATLLDLGRPNEPSLSSTVPSPSSPTRARPG